MRFLYFPTKNLGRRVPDKTITFPAFAKLVRGRMREWEAKEGGKRVLT